MLDAVRSTQAAAAPPPPQADAAQTLLGAHTAFGAVDTRALAGAVATAPGDKAQLAAEVTRGLDARDQSTFVSELTVIAHRQPAAAAPPPADDRPHSLFDHLKDAGGVVLGAAGDLLHLAGNVAKTAVDVSPLGIAVDAARQAAGLVTGHTPDAPAWAPSAERGASSLASAGHTAWTAATHPGAVIDALKAPYQKDWAEGRWGALAAQTVLDFGGLLDGESEALVGAKIASAAEKTAAVTEDVSRGAKVADAVEDAKRLEGAVAPEAKAAPAAIGGLTRLAAKTGENTVTWTLNADGRGVEAQAVLRQSFDGAERSGGENKLTEAAGKSGGRIDDDGGHMIAHRFMLDQGEKNMFPQNANFNRGAYKTLENEWAAWTKAGGEVRIDVKLRSFDDVDRPASVSVTYEVVNPKTGESVYKNYQRFSNEGGQTFDRLSVNDIAKKMGVQ